MLCRKTNVKHNGAMTSQQITCQWTKMS